MLVCYQNTDSVSYADTERKLGKLPFQVDLVVGHVCEADMDLGQLHQPVRSQRHTAVLGPRTVTRAASGSGSESRDGRVWGFSPHFHRSCRSHRNESQYCFCIPLSGLPEGNFTCGDGWETKVETVGGLRLKS